MPANILLPDGVDMTKWACVACDQFTSDRSYWDSVESFVGDAPSTLRMFLPEAKLSDPDLDGRIRASWRAMDDYLASGVLKERGECFIYVERTVTGGKLRRGLVGAVDLELYDYSAGASSPIRATEGTVLSRIPPRVKLREGASIELPHVMLLCDDADDEMIGRASAMNEELPLAYSFDLMQGGGHIEGRVVEGAALSAIAEGMERYARAHADFRFASGDGNHSLATAKACYESAKAAGKPAQRYALVELVNLHDDALTFEPIHRFAFGAEIAKLREAAGKTSGDTVYNIEYRDEYGSRGVLELRGARDMLPVGILQDLLDSLGADVDYIHGESEVLGLDGGVAFLLEPMDKRALFPAVVAGGCLPRKTFSMGEARDKRYYLEGRRI